MFDIIDEDIWELDQGMAERQSIYLEPTVLKNRYVDVIGLIKYMMQCGYYVIGFYNEYYIHGKGSYKKENFWHDYVLFGYEICSKRADIWFYRIKRSCEPKIQIGLLVNP